MLDRNLRRDIKELEDEFVEEFKRYVPQNTDYSVLNAQDVTSQIIEQLRARSLPIISLDRVYVPKADIFLEVTRQTDQETGEISITERPGSSPLAKQIATAGKYGEAILVDVGAFEGSTLMSICGLLNQTGINIEEIVLGISSKEANRKLNNTRKVTSLNLFDFYEWIELRDLLGIDGRNTGIRKGKREFMPYWENLCKWASISLENKDGAEKLCKYFNSLLIGRLWQEGYDLAKIGRPVKYLGAK